MRMNNVTIIDMCGSCSMPLRGPFMGVGPRVFMQGVIPRPATQASCSVPRFGIAQGDWLPAAKGSPEESAVQALRQQREERRLAKWIADSARRGIPGRFARHAGIKRLAATQVVQ